MIYFVLQFNADKLSLQWPFGETVTNNHGFSSETMLQVNSISYDMAVGEDRSVLYIDTEYLKMDPLGMSLTIIFGMLLVVQFCGMIIHRLMTLSHIVSTTNTTFNVKKRELQNR